MRFCKRLFFGVSFLSVSAASLYCLWLAVGFFLYPALAAPTDVAETGVDSSLPEETAESNREETIPESSAPAEVAAKTDGTVKGKILRKQVDNKAANLQYNRVSVKNGTSQKMDLKAELLAGPALKIENTDQPQVLILHTHTTECYMPESREYYTAADATRSVDQSKNVVAVGEVLKEGLQKKGIAAIHATEVHDYPEYTGSYNRAAETVRRYLAKYPTLRVVIDLHRDSITANDGTKTAVVTEIDGKPAAQVMLVSGCEDGTVTDFPNWRENFRLAIKLQQTIEVMYPTLTRPILFTPRRYNQHLTKGSLLIECGTEANTLEEAKYAAELLADSLAATLRLL